MTHATHPAHVKGETTPAPLTTAPNAENVTPPGRAPQTAPVAKSAISRRRKLRGLSRTNFNIFRSMVTDIPDTMPEFIVYLDNATTEQLVSVLMGIKYDIEDADHDHPLLEQVRSAILSHIRARADFGKIEIWVDCDVEPPEWVWNPDIDKHPVASPGARPRSAPTHLQRHPRGSLGKSTGFATFIALERQICQRRAAKPECAIARRSQGVEPEPSFIEVPGPVALFAVSEAARLYASAESEFGPENKRYAHNRLRELAARGNRRDLAKAPSAVQIEDLRRRFPNAAELIDVVARAAALSRLTRDQHFCMPPILLAGDPGIGKTAVVNALAACMGSPFDRIDIGTLSTGNQLFGTSLTWSTGRTGFVFNMLAAAEVLNPVVLLDELDKARGNERSSVIPPLLSLLEPVTSRSFKDEAIPIGLNASHIIWIATANDLSIMPAPLLSRFTVVTMKQPVGEVAVQVAQEIYGSICSTKPWGRKFVPDLDRPVALCLADYTPRQMRLCLEHACGAAALAGRHWIVEEDVSTWEPEGEQVPVKRRIGFV